MKLQDLHLFVARLYALEEVAKAARQVINDPTVYQLGDLKRALSQLAASPWEVADE